MNVSYPDVNQETKQRLDTLNSAFSNERESATVIHNQESLINEFLKAAFFSMRIEIPNNVKVCQISAATRSHRFPYGLEDPCCVSMINLLRYFDYRSSFFDLFKQKNTLSNDFVFPSISNNPEKMQKLACLLDFCAAHPDSLESAEINTDKLQFEKDKSLWNLYYQTAPEPKSVTANLLKHMNTNMVVLGGFIAALGIAAVAIAVTVLSASTFGFGLAVLGIAGMGWGAGMVLYGLFANRPPKADGSPDDLYEKLTTNYSPFPRQF